MFAGAAFALFEPLLLQGDLFAWILRDPERLPDAFPLSSEWRLVLFGLGALQFARHPEGLLEAGKARWIDRIERRLPPPPPPAPAPSDVREEVHA